MTARSSVGAVLASALRKVIGGRLQQSNLGEVWREDRTWLELARELDGALVGKLVLVDKTIYAGIVADAMQMRLVRQYIEEYKSKLSPEKKRDGERNPYIRWMNEVGYGLPPKEDAK